MNSTIVKPTIGRKVWFWPNGATIGAPGTKQPEVFMQDQAMDATIVCVWGDRMVNLSVTDHGGTVHSIRSVPLVQQGDVPLTGMYCEWMPYQLAQASKPADSVVATLTVSKETADAMERLIQRLDRELCEAP